MVGHVHSPAMKTLPLFLSFLLPVMFSCASDEKMAEVPAVPEGCEEITLGAGCFWCTEAVYQQIDGVRSVTSGYMGGHVDNPTYEQVCSKKTGHVEVVHVVYDPAKVSLKEILKWFWKLHDPTQADGQGADIGPQYLSTIFTYSAEQKKIAEESKAEAQKGFDTPIATTIRDASTFWPAEDYHQDYYSQNKSRNPYCRAVIVPKLEKLGLEK
jgi:peptide-methionine (S)-S-oxide reductase